MIITSDEILAFYLGGATDDPIAMRTCVERWFSIDPELDEIVRRRYLEAIDAALTGAFDHWQVTARGALALILLLDQLPRNAYRGSGKAFAGDARARAVAHYGIECSYPDLVPIVPSVFFFMPFEHAEDVGLQQKCARGYEMIHARAPQAFKPNVAAFVQAGREHAAVVKRFGRFPHRNALLGRESTEEELAWLAENRNAWGQGAADLEDAGLTSG
ncbi:MAG: DUF924 family protein [Pseudomonadota bacterium]